MDSIICRHPQPVSRAKFQALLANCGFAVRSRWITSSVCLTLHVDVDPGVGFAVSQDARHVFDAVLCLGQRRHRELQHLETRLRDIPNSAVGDPGRAPAFPDSRIHPKENPPAHKGHLYPLVLPSYKTGSSEVVPRSNQQNNRHNAVPPIEVPKRGAMKAIRLHRRGGPEQLIYEDAPKPSSLQPGDALVRVYACAITPTELSWSATYTTKNGDDRLPSIPGHELSGVVEAVTPDASDEKLGDAVYALTDFWRDGAAANYVAVRASGLAPKPPSLSHAQAAAVPLSALAAWQALFDHAGLVKGHETQYFAESFEAPAWRSQWVEHAA